jgi:hypothetical protein
MTKKALAIPAKKKVIPIKAISAGAAALAKYREELAAATKKGPKALAAFKAARQKAKPTKNGGATPMQAIKQFCMFCVGEHMEDVRNCTAKNCPLYHLRPYQ